MNDVKPGSRLVLRPIAGRVARAGSRLQAAALRATVLAVLALAACGGGPGAASGGRAGDRSGAPDSAARRLVRGAVDAMGGEKVLRGLDYLRLRGVEVTSMVGVSPDSEPPRLLHATFDELRDVRAGRALRRAEFRMVMRADPIPVTQVIDTAASSFEAAEGVMYAPERLLLLVLEAPDLALAPDTSLPGGGVRVVRFGSPAIRLYLDPASGLPRGWSTVRTYPRDLNVWAPWGDVRSLTLFGSWALEPDGLRYPRTITVARNGTPYRRISVLGVHEAEASPDSFATPPGAAPPGPVRLGNGRGSEAVEPAPGVVLVPGAYNVVLVRQGDGVVVLEAPHSGAYSRLVLEEAARRWPDLPVKALVSTTDAWPHDAGVREYVARGVPIYAPARGAALIRRLASAPHRLAPDSLQRAPRPPDLRVVGDTTVIGSGPDQVVLAAVAGPAGGGGRLLIAFLPERRLLYASDLLIPQRFEPEFWLGAWTSLLDDVRGHGWAVDTVMALHDAPVALSSVRDAVATAAGKE